jgi:hypothetical protein
MKTVGCKNKGQWLKIWKYSPMIKYIDNGENIIRKQETELEINLDD